MSARIQSLVAPVRQPGKASTTAFVNLYQEANGNIYFGSKTFRQERNAIAKGRANVGGKYLRTVAVSAEQPVL